MTSQKLLFSSVELLLYTIIFYWITIIRFDRMWLVLVLIQCRHRQTMWRVDERELHRYGQSPLKQQSYVRTCMTIKRSQNYRALPPTSLGITSTMMLRDYQFHTPRSFAISEFNLKFIHQVVNFHSPPMVQGFVVDSFSTNQP